MTATYCPSCYEPLTVPPHAREGRCPRCRPRREHLQLRKTGRTNFEAFVAAHRGATQ
jgi:hypothetical protein